MTFDLEAQLETSFQAYFDNSAWFEHQSYSEALAFATACQQLIMLMPQLARQAGRFELQFNPRTLPVEKADAQLWASLNDPNHPGVRGFDFTNFRDT